MTDEKRKAYEEYMSRFMPGIKQALDEERKKYLKRISKIQTDEDVVKLIRDNRLRNESDFDLLLKRKKINAEQHHCFQQEYCEYRIHRFRQNLGTQWFFRTHPMLIAEKFIEYDPTKIYPESREVYEKYDIHKIDFLKNKVFLECRDTKTPYAKKPTYYAVHSINEMSSSIEKVINDDSWADNSYYCQCLIFKNANS